MEIKTMLKKLEYYYNEDGEKIDITDEKIYWDTQKNQFRHKFKCGDCGKSLGCYCFGHLDGIIEAVEYGYRCNKCPCEAGNGVDPQQLDTYIWATISNNDSDERMSYPDDNIFVNAPLALHQVSQKAKRNI